MTSFIVAIEPELIAEEISTEDLARILNWLGERSEGDMDDICSCLGDFLTQDGRVALAVLAAAAEASS